MSQMSVFTNTSPEFKLNVVQFRSPMSATITSVQTKTMLQHFPIRAGQPDIQFTVQFASMDDKHEFDGFVRQHQLDTRNISQADPKLVTLWWPERNIENWTGYICSYQVTEARFVYAPRVTFGVSLVDSMMSERTTLASGAQSIWKILGWEIPEYKGYEDTILIKPTRPNVAQSGPNIPGAINSGDAP